MDDFRYPKQIFDYRSTERRRPGRTLKENWTDIIVRLKQVI